MARKAREKSESGIYHVVLKGNDRLLFVDKDDYEYFLGLLEKTSERDLMEVYAYCLFSETAHLIIKEGLPALSNSLKSLISAYAVRCNEKYARSGKLFYDRFISEPVESDDEVLDAVRFTHRLPLSHGLTLDYEYSSYNNYISKRGLRSDALMLLFDDSILRYREEHELPPERTYASGEKKAVLTDEQVVALLRRMTGSMTAEEAENLSIEVLGNLVNSLRNEGASIRQLSRVLQVSKSTVERAIKAYAEATL